MSGLRNILLAGLLSLPIMGGAEVLGYAVNSDDESQADQLLRIDLETGQTQMIGRLPALLEDVEGLAFDLDGALFGVDSASKTLVRVATETGAAESVAGQDSNLGFPPTSTFDFGMTFTCSGQLLLVAEQTGSLYEVDSSTGMARVIGSSGGLGDTMTAIASFGDQTFALAADSRNFYEVDVATGTASRIGTIDGFDITDAGMAFDTDGRLWVISSDFSFDPSKIFTLNPQTVEATQVATTRAGVESLAIAPPSGCGAGTPAPGPGAGAGENAVEVPTMGFWAMILMSLALLAVAHRRLALLSPRRTR